MPTRQPNSRHCFVCGVNNPFGLKLRFETLTPGEVEAHVIIGENYQGYPGVVHGGIVAAMLDEVAGRSHMGGDPPRFMFTGRLEIRYVKNVPVGKPLRLVGQAGRTRGRVSEATSRIYDAQGTLLAEASALLVDVPAGTIPTNILDELGWGVYPDGDELTADPTLPTLKSQEAG